MNTFLTSNSAKWRLARTIVQGVIAAIIANLVDILGLIHMSPELITVAVPIIMAILSPIMEYLGRSLYEQEEE
jgi:hypothetical protein